MGRARRKSSVRLVTDVRARRITVAVTEEGGEGPVEDKERVRDNRLRPGYAPNVWRITSVAMLLSCAHFVLYTWQLGTSSSLFGPFHFSRGLKVNSPS